MKKKSCEVPSATLMNIYIDLWATVYTEKQYCFRKVAFLCINLRGDPIHMLSYSHALYFDLYRFHIMVNIFVLESQYLKYTSGRGILINLHRGSKAGLMIHNSGMRSPRLLFHVSTTNISV